MEKQIAYGDGEALIEIDVQCQITKYMWRCAVLHFCAIFINYKITIDSSRQRGIV